MLLAKKVLWFLLILFILAIIATGIFLLVNGNSHIAADKGVFV